MARRITNDNVTTTQYAYINSLLGITGYPFTLFAWSRCRKFNALHWIMGFEDSGSGTFPTQALRFIPDAAGSIPWSGLSVNAQDGSGLPGEEEAQILIGGGPDTFDSSFDGWMCCIGRYYSETFRDGFAYYVHDDSSITRYYASKTSAGTTGDDQEVAFDSAAMDRFIVGHQDRQSPADWDASIDILNMMVHSVTLSDQECDMLGSGCNPRIIDPANRVELWPCNEQTTGADFIGEDGNYDLTTVGNISYVSDHPKILVHDSNWDAVNKTSLALNFQDYNNKDYAGNDIPGMAGQYVSTVQYRDNNDGESAQSSDSALWEVELVEDSAWDAVNKTSYTTISLADGDYFSTLQYRDNNDGESLESAPDEFTIISSTVKPQPLQSIENQFAPISANSINGVLQ